MTLKTCIFIFYYPVCRNQIFVCIFFGRWADNLTFHSECKGVVVWDGQRLLSGSSENRNFFKDFKSSLSQYFCPEVAKMKILLSNVDMGIKSYEVNFFDWCIKNWTSHRKITSKWKVLGLSSNGLHFGIFIFSLTLGH